MQSSALTVLAVMPGLSPDGGAERSFADMVPHLVADGVDLHLALLTPRAELAPAVTAAGATVHDLSTLTGTIGRTRALRRLISTTGAALVHATLFEATVPAQLATTGTRTPILVTWANTSYTPGHLAAVGVHPAKLRAVQGVEIVLGRLSSSWYHAVTPGVATSNAHQLRAPSDRVLVGERGRASERFEVSPDRVAAFRSELGVGHDTPLVVAIGRQDTQKSYGTLLDAFDRVAADDDAVHLVVAGRPGSDTPRLQARLAASPHRDRIRFLGHRDDAEVILAAATVVVCTSRYEGAAGALIEAMASSAPIVSVELEGLQGVLIDGRNALVVPRDGVADGLSRVLGSTDLSTALGTAARRTYEDRFTIERSAARLAEIYRTVASG